MKKILAGSTALVAAAVVAGQAQAADPIQIKVGGFMEQWVGAIDSDNNNQTNGTVDHAEVRQSSDTELYFRGSTTLDNGLKVFVVIDKEADRGSSGQDDVYLEVEHMNLGEIRLGATGGYGTKTVVMSPDVGIGQGDADAWVPSAVTHIDRDNGGDDGQKIYYATPSLGGFSLGASYGTKTVAGSSGSVNLATNSTSSSTQSTTNGGNVTTTISSSRQEIETTFGLGYNGEFQGVGISFGTGYIESVDENNTNAAYADEEEFHIGLGVSAAGFTVSGGYTEVEALGSVKGRDAEVWDIGVSYSFEKYAVSASFTSSEVEASATDNRTDEYELFMVSGAYDLGAGVVAKASVFSSDESDSANVRTSENDGFGVVAGLRVDF